MEAQLLDFDMEAYAMDYSNPYTGYSKKDYDRCQVEEKQKFYKQQFEEFSRLIEDIWLAYQVAKTISTEDGIYYLQVHIWVLNRYYYLLKYSHNYSTPF